MKTKSTSLLSLIAAVAGTLLMSLSAPITPHAWAASAAAPKMPPVLSFATAAEGTTSYIVGGAFANLLKKYLNVKVA
ncbi:MAG TPA: hypothetical protein VJ646_08160, partial [Candidatus Binatia bacterium]|nr:hypothetical protein [Candidatus Binatia bacterium]